MFRRATTVYAVAGLVALMCVGTAKAGTADLAGVTTIIAASSGVTDVEVRAPARLSTAIENNATISMQGQGLAYGFVLEQSTPTSLGPYFAAFRARPNAGCEAECGNAFGVYLDTFSSMEPGPNPNEVIIAPGRYRLGVLAPEGPVTITLRPAGATGTTTISELAPTAAVTRVLPRLDDGSVPNTTWHGASAPLPTRGIMYYAQAAHYDTFKAASEREFCDYEGEPTDSLAYAPSCPGGSGGFIGPGLIIPGPFTEYMYGFLRVVKPQTYGIGGNVTSASGGLTAGGVGAWLPLYPPQAGSGHEGQTSPPPPQRSAPDAKRGDVKTSRRTPERLFVGKVNRRGRSVTIRLRCEAAARCTGRARAGGATRRFSVAAGKSQTLRLTAPRRTRVTVVWAIAGGPSGRAVRR
jgi:hypothetical protein